MRSFGPGQVHLTNGAGYPGPFFGIPDEVFAAAAAAGANGAGIPQGVDLFDPGRNDWSGQIESGGFAQDAAPANESRQYLLLSNPTLQSLWWAVDFDASLGAPATEILPGASLLFTGDETPTGPVSIAGATDEQEFIVIDG